MKFIVRERWYKTYEIEADSFEEAMEKANDPPEESDFDFEAIAYITAEDGREQIYS